MFELPKNKMEFEALLDKVEKLMGSDTKSQRYADGYEIMETLRAFWFERSGAK